jgi:hypothetical protein
MPQPRITGVPTEGDWRTAPTCLLSLQSLVPKGFKVKLCPLEQRESGCPRGDLCNDAHAVEQLRIEEAIKLGHVDKLYKCNICKQHARTGVLLFPLPPPCSPLLSVCVRVYVCVAVFVSWCMHVCLKVCLGCENAVTAGCEFLSRTFVRLARVPWCVSIQESPQK